MIFRLRLLIFYLHVRRIARPMWVLSTFRGAAVNGSNNIHTYDASHPHVGPLYVCVDKPNDVRQTIRARIWVCRSLFVITHGDLHGHLEHLRGRPPQRDVVLHLPLRLGHLVQVGRDRTGYTAFVLVSSPASTLAPKPRRRPAKQAPFAGKDQHIHADKDREIHAAYVWDGSLHCLHAMTSGKEKEQRG